jgi:hypothetical protein
MARYADSLLTQGEEIVLRTRQHWLALVADSRLGWLLWIVAIVILVAIRVSNDTGVLNQVGSVGAIALLIVGLIIVAYRYWNWWATDYAVTNRRLLKVTGILNKRSTDSSLEKVNDAILTQPLLGRMLNYGDLEILTAADVPNDLYHMLNDPKGFKKTMLTQKHDLETEFRYAGAPTPPLRAEMEAPAATAAAAAPPPPPAAPAPALAPEPTASVAEPSAAAPDKDESQEVTETLSRLADLRDEGAITAEEYEQKKAELLGRL